MNVAAPDSLAPYNWRFVGWYFAMAVAVGFLSTIIGPKANFFSLFAPGFAAFMALKAFQRDLGRRVDDEERARMIRFALIFLTVLVALLLFSAKAMIDANPMLRLRLRPMPVSGIVFTVGVSALINWGLLALSFRVAQMFMPPLPRQPFAASAMPSMAAAGAASPAAGSAVRAAAGAAGKLRVLVLGNGGREHALAWKLAQSPRTLEVLVAPGNAGTANEPKVRNVEADLGNVAALLALARREQVDLTVVGPEGPLVAGVVDAFQAAGLRVFGPSAAAAQLEGSKAFAKEFMQRHGIPTAAHAVFDELEPALAHVRAQGAPIVIKADGLASGKGVVVATTLAEAEAALTKLLGGGGLSLVGTGPKVVIEEFLDGEEASFIVMADGRTFVPMATSQDHKRVGDGDTGPNTGGMGAYSPAPVVTDAVHARVVRDIIEPTLRGLRSEGMPFAGFLYAGLMIDRDGTPKVIEFNVRFGDPETQPILMRLQTDLVALLEAAVDQRLAQVPVRWNPRPALAVVMAAAGYPDAPRTGDAIRGLGGRTQMDVRVFHAATRADGDRVLTAGGRVLTVCALGDTIAEAQMRAYDAVDAIGWDGEHHRRDIGGRALGRRNAEPTTA